ncbi:MAG: hypothetical protein IJ228_03765 [Succinivibrio sp.]|nr:hypothetical protein [Succinivibrio sp.]
MEYTLDLFQTAAAAVVVLFTGITLKRRFKFLEEYCIPSPVVGGLIFSLVLGVLHFFGLEVIFDEDVEDLFMLAFFTSVGFQISLKLISGSLRILLTLLLAMTILTLLQNALAVAGALVGELDPLRSLSAGSITMMGGEGMALVFGPILEDLTVAHGLDLCLGAASLGLVLSVLLGGPLGRYLILKHHLSPATGGLEEPGPQHTHPLGAQRGEQMNALYARLARACYQLIVAMGLGVLLCKGIELSGVKIPHYIGAMLMAVILRNLSEKSGRYHFEVNEMSFFGGFALSLFLAINFAEIPLWQVAGLDGGDLVLIAAQLVLITIFCLLLFRLLGGDYDAAVISSASCSVGIGATPSGISAILVLAGRFGYSLKAYLLVPVVCTMLIDPLNSLIIAMVIKMF